MKIILSQLIRIVILILLSKPVYTQDFQTTCDSYIIDQTFIVTENVHPVSFRTFSEMTTIYCSPDHRSEILGHIPFNTQLESEVLIVREQLDSTKMYLGSKKWYNYHWNSSKWQKIKYKNIVGFIPSWSISSDQDDHKFLVNEYRHENESFVRVKLPASDKNFVLDEIHFGLMHGYRFFKIENCLLDKSEGLYCYETYRESCPGASEYTIFQVTDTGFEKLISRFSTGEAGTSDVESLYLPFRGKDGSVGLYDFDAAVEAHFNDESLSKEDIFLLPENLGIPINNCIVKTHVYTETILNEDDIPIELENGDYKVDLVEDVPLIYKWNGAELKELGVFDFTKRINELTNELDKLKQSNKTITPKKKGVVLEKR